MYQALAEGISSYQGRSHEPRVGCSEKSADVIVTGSNEPIEESEASQPREGRNVELFPIRQRSVFMDRSFALNEKQGNEMSKR